MHASGQVIKAVRLGLPTVITVRDPIGAVVSVVSRWPHVTPAQGLRAYVRYYDALQPYVDAVVLSTFQQTTQHFDEVINRANGVFERDFGLFDPSPDNVQRIRNPSAIESQSERSRSQIKDRLRSALRLPSYRPLLERAEAIYARLEEAEHRQASSF